MVLIYLAGWLVLGYAGGWIAAKKGYPPKLGIAIGIIFGPIALAVFAVMPATREGREQAQREFELNAEATEFAKRRECPECGREVSIRVPAAITGFRSRCGRCIKKPRLGDRAAVVHWFTDRILGEQDYSSAAPEPCCCSLATISASAWALRSSPSFL